MPAGRHLFIPFLRTKSQMGQTKNRIKETNRTKIIATNFVWEQLKNFVWELLNKELTTIERVCNPLKIAIHRMKLDLFSWFDAS